jgi:predicted ATPase
MAIQQLDVHGYRSFREAHWQPGRLNLLTGPNGSGKSNLLRLLEFVSRTARGKLADTMTEVGGIVPLLWNQTAKRFGWTVRIDPVDDNRDLHRDALTFELELQQVRSGSSYLITKDNLGNWFEFERGTQPKPYWIYTRDDKRAMVYDQQAHGLVRPEDVDNNESLLSQISEPRTNPIPSHTKRFIESWRIYHDVHVERGSPMRMPATTQHVKLVASDGSNLATVLHTLYTSDRDFKRQINQGMKAGFGDEFEELVFQPAAAHQIQLAVAWKSCKQPHAGQDLSDGTLRFLFLLTVLASPEPAPLIAIDEPEIGLHPSMLPIIAEYAAGAAERTQVILTSHSPDFLDAFTDFSPQVTVFHWEEGESHLFTIPPDRLQKWLDRYRLGQLFTSGDLEAICLPDVEKLEDADARFEDLPSEETAIPRRGKQR